MRLMKLLAVCVSLACAVHVNAEALRMGRFGVVDLYHAGTNPAHVVLLLSGDAGWNVSAAELAADLSSQTDSLVVGIDSRHYQGQLALSHERCHYPAADLEALSKFVQKSLEFPQYITPVLLGYLSGGTVAYGALVQAPPGTFAGAISIGFCPRVSLSRPFCRGYGLQSEELPAGKGYRFLPISAVKDPWSVIQGGDDPVCRAEEASTFVARVKGAQIQVLAGRGHGMATVAQWMPAVKMAFSGMMQARDDYKKSTAPVSGPKDLPLVELPARKPEADLFAVIVSGDGGWASIDRQIGEALVQDGIPVVGLNSLQYFWKERTQAEMSGDLARILNYYLTGREKSGAILIGYSLGADVLPFMVSPLPESLKAKIIDIALLGPSPTVDFEFHLTDWLGSLSGRAGHATGPEVEKLKGKKILCFYGEEEKDSLCPRLSPALAVPVRLQGGHHFDGGYGPIVDRILKEAAPPSHLDK